MKLTIFLLQSIFFTLFMTTQVKPSFEDNLFLFLVTEQGKAPQGFWWTVELKNALNNQIPEKKSALTRHLIALTGNKILYRQNEEYKKGLDLGFFRGDRYFSSIPYRVRLFHAVDDELVGQNTNFYEATDYIINKYPNILKTKFEGSDIDLKPEKLLLTNLNENDCLYIKENNGPISIDEYRKKLSIHHGLNRKYTNTITIADNYTRCEMITYVGRGENYTYRDWQCSTKIGQFIKDFAKKEQEA